MCENIYIDFADNKLQRRTHEEVKIVFWVIHPETSRVRLVFKELQYLKK